MSVNSPDRIGLSIEGQGRPIVLLHSTMSSSSQWRELVQALSSQYRLIAIDLLGYGKSSLRRNASGYELADEVRHVEAALAEALEPGEAFHLVGHSYGGVVALELARRTPRLLSLTLFEPIAIQLLAAEHRARVAFADLAAEMTWQADAGREAEAAALFVDYWSGAGTFAAMPEVKRTRLERLVPKVLLEHAALQRVSLVAADLRGIEAPVCLISGRASPMPAQLLTARLAYLLPQAQCVEVAGGHMAPISDPGLVNPVIARFISAVESRPTQRLVRGWGSILAARAPRRVAARSVACGVLAALAAFAPVEHIARAGGYPHAQLAAPVYMDGIDVPNALQSFPRDGRFMLVSGDSLSHQPYVLVLEPAWPNNREPS